MLATLDPIEVGFLIGAVPFFITWGILFYITRGHHKGSTAGEE